ncbi:hypothetical protein MTR_2g009990 [Medicago truncatula]|uniref:Uncharacterized protein n=1 Tax=Medicago truncatula TaxID=3880 RepID=G7IS94_MEDTR|nr:hypothetical protein MTR_2g009990 [Medicago truncatula]
MVEARVGNRPGRPIGAYGLAIGQAQTCDLFRRPGSGLSKSGLTWPIPIPNRGIQSVSNISMSWGQP